jgi:hypothetical protein
MTGVFAFAHADENEKKVRLEEKLGCGTPPPRMLCSIGEVICRETIHGLFYMKHEYFHIQGN